MRTVLVVILALGLVEAACGADPLDIRASIWSYKTICDFEDMADSSPITIKYKSDYSVVISGCTDQEKALGHPPAVRFALRNVGQAAVELPVPNLDAVSVTGKNGKTVQALARREPVRGPFPGTMMAFVSEAKGNYVIVLKPGQQTNLVYLFASAVVGDTVRLGEMQPLTIK